MNTVDASFAKQAGNILAENPVGSAFYSRLQRQGTDVNFVNDPLMVEMGIFDRGANSVTVNMARHTSPTDVASTVVHEATHQNRFFRTGNAGTQYEEFLSFRNESLFETGVRPSLDERRFIWEKVQQLYPELPQGKSPFGGGQ